MSTTCEITEQQNKTKLRLEHANRTTEEIERRFNALEPKVKCR